MSRRVKVLYIAGEGRCGSTILGNTLGQIDGWFFGGEICDLRRRGLQDNAVCGCSTPFHDCPLWSEVVRGKLGEHINDQANCFYCAEESPLRQRRLCPNRKKELLCTIEKEKTSWLHGLDHLYHSIAHTSETRVIVDTSKRPSYALFLECARQIDLYVLHLVRDVRGSVYSWSQRPKVDMGMREHDWLKRTAHWSKINNQIASLWGGDKSRYFFLRYEDFVKDPARTMRSVTRFVHEKDASFPFLNGDIVHLNTTHALWGNDSRFAQGPVRLREDAKWRSALPSSQKLAITALMAPWLVRYGYPVFQERAG